MNRKVFYATPILLAICLPTLLDRNNNPIVAYAYSTTPLATTLDLNDTSNDDIRTYYDSVDGLKGNDLLIKLKEVLSTNQKYYSYDSGNAIWQMYEIIDRDWDKSPKEQIEGYNASTNTVTGYVYGSSKSKPGSNPYVRALYNNRDVENETRAWDSHGERSNPWTIEREHIWPKSHGFDQTLSDTGGARGDPMHLWAANGYANGVHSNDFYGYVDTSKIDTDCSEKHPNLKGNLSGTSKTLGTIKVFEPQDSDKGDIARAVFYMAARYNNLSGLDDNIDANNPYLIVSNDTNGTAGTSTKTTPFSLGILTDLIEWNKLDPVDEFEIHRNNLLFNNYTNNRNPFIDFPQWVDIIWGDATAVARPKSDAINDSLLNISKSSVSLLVNDTISLSASSSESGVSISWSVIDNTIASIDKTTTQSGENVTITALKLGETTIKASITIDEETYEKICTIKVIEKEKTIVDKIMGLPLPVLIGIGVGALLIIIIIIVVLSKSKKARKVAKKIVKSQTKNNKKKSKKK